MSATRSAAREAARRTRFALVLALVLVLVQSLGLLHGVAHVDHLHGGGDGTGGPAAAFAAPALAELPDLFGGHGEPADCELFDQASHADLANGAGPSSAAAVEPVPALEPHASWHVAAQAQGFRARAPPVLT